MNDSSRGSFLAAAIVLAVSGVLSGGALLASFLSDPDGGANIGAGLLLLIGLAVALAGVVLLVVALVSLVRTRRRVGRGDGETGREHRPEGQAAEG